MKRVLVVDDVPEVRLVYKALLSDPDMEIVEAGSGEKALEILNAIEVSLLITDCQMPGMGGLEMVRRAKQMQPDLPLIVVSSTADPKDFAQFEPLAIMSKPFRLTDLKDAVEGALADG